MLKQKQMGAVIEQGFALNVPPQRAKEKNENDDQTPKPNPPNQR